MKLPLFEQNKRLNISVRALDGGLDTDRPAWLIADNALSDAQDIWWQDGALRTRKGFYTCLAWESSEPTNATVRYYTDREGWIACIALQTIAASSILTVTARSPSGGSEARLLHVTLPLGGSYACVPAGGSADDYTLLLYLSDHRIFALHLSHWLASEMTDRIHIPTISLNGCPREGFTVDTAGFTMHEARNRLTDRVRCCFTPDGIGTYYYLPYQQITGEVSVHVAGALGSVWTYVIADGESVSSHDGNRMVVLDRYCGMLYFSDDNGMVVLPSQGIANTVQVDFTAPMTSPLVFDMTFGTWYSGDKNTTGRERLFLSGNGDAPHTVIWSAEENPFYFPETAIAAVGAAGEAITAFGKQDGNLVLFKERELYTAEYVRGGMEDILPVYALNTEIGCDLPQTVGLVGDRLVWVCRNGNVYQLTRLTATGSRRVVPIGAAVRRFLSPPVGENAMAQVCGEVYYLMSGNNILVLTDSEKGTWYRFVWPQNGLMLRGIYRCQNDLRFLAHNKTIAGKTHWFSFLGTYDVFPMDKYTSCPVEGVVCTKAFDGGQSTAYKQVLRATVESTSPLQFSYITERGEYGDCVHMPDAGGLIRCTPQIGHTRRVALQLKGEAMAMCGITVSMRAERGTGW